MAKRFEGGWARWGFAPRLLDLREGYTGAQALRDVGAGITVAMVALPLAMAFAIASGLPPQAGLFTAVVGGFLISFLSGSPVQIGGPAGAFIVVVYGIVQEHGVTGLWAATFLSGVMLWLMGFLRLGVLIQFIPVAVILGFTNGIAVLIAFSQIADFLGLSLSEKPAAWWALVKALWTARHSWSGEAVLVGVLSLMAMIVWHQMQGMWRGRWRMLAFVPASLLALLVSLGVVWSLGLQVQTIGSRFGGIPQGLPPLSVPDFQQLSALFKPAFTLAILGAIESLLCARVADYLLNDRHHANQELMAQGVANMLTPWFSGMPATGTIARTVTNIKSGGRTPIAGMTHALTILGVMLLFAPFAQYIPLPCLAAILLFVSWNMGEWKAFVALKSYRVPYRLTFLAVFVLTVVVDLTVAVLVGMVLAMVIVLYRLSQLMEEEVVDVREGVVMVSFRGALFFGAVQHLAAWEESLPKKRLILDLSGVIYMDSTGAEALSALWRKSESKGVDLWLCGLRPQVLSMIERVGLAKYLSYPPFTDSQSALLLDTQIHERVEKVDGA
ncbi:MAG: SulP family inorganic anion transporter [Cardiobacteriaceae bacterium]|nr:SulP family inorganic anion transporter [Cardiobacteriaceae bacterium]